MSMPHVLLSVSGLVTQDISSLGTTVLQVLRSKDVSWLQAETAQSDELGSFARSVQPAIGNLFLDMHPRNSKAFASQMSSRYNW